MTVLHIRGHYGSVTSQLTQIDDSRYRLQLADDFCRFGGFHASDLTSEGYSFVDPAGGPYMSVGASLNSFHKSLPDKSIVRITNDDGIILHV